MKWTVMGGIVATVFVATAAMAWAQDITEARFGANPPVKIVAPKGMTASGYSSMLFNSYTNILGSNAPLGRYISAADIVVLCPPASLAVLNGKRPTTSTVAGKNGFSSTPIPVESKLSPTGTYIIYVMGRRFLTVDSAMAKANNVSSSASLATRLARQYMQRFPRECFRPPALSATVNVPANPPLYLTTNIEQCVPPDVRGRVSAFGKGLFNTAPVQPDGSTGPDKAALLNQKTNMVLGGPLDHPATDITAVKNGKLADVKVGPKVLYTVSDFDAKSNGFKNALGFAQFLTIQIQKRITEASPVAEPAVTPAPAPVQ